MNPATPVDTRNAITLVARREITTRGRSKAFIISLISTVVFILAAAILFKVLDTDEPIELGIVGGDQSEAIALLEQTMDLLDRELEIVTFADRTEAEIAIDNGDIDGAVVDGERLVVKRSDPELVGMVSPAWQQANLLEGLTLAGLSDAEIAEALQQASPLVEEELDVDADREAKEGVAFFSVVLLFLATQVTGAYIMMGVLEEKSTKVVEIILSSISARNLLIGKVLGIGVIGLVQVAVLIGSALTAAAIVGSATIPPISGAMVIASFAWFLIGYLLFGSLFAAGASLAPRQEDAQAALAPVTVITMLSYFASIFIATSPERLGAKILSMVPVVAPFAMPGRIAVGDITAWEVALSFVIAIVAVGLVMVAAGRIYTRSVMHTDRAIKWREAWRLDG